MIIWPLGYIAQIMGYSPQVCDWEGIMTRQVVVIVLSLTPKSWKQQAGSTLVNRYFLQVFSTSYLPLLNLNKLPVLMFGILITYLECWSLNFRRNLKEDEISEWVSLNQLIPTLNLTMQDDIWIWLFYCQVLGEVLCLPFELQFKKPFVTIH